MAKSYESLCENYSFRRVYARGKSYVSPVVVTYIQKNRDGKLRIGITTSKKIGNAVKRNRARRIIRAALSMHLPKMKQNYDIVFVARTKTPFVKSTDICKVLSKQLFEAGVLK